MRVVGFLILVQTLTGCVSDNAQIFKPSDPNFRYGGRVDHKIPDSPVFISSASYVEFSYQGKECTAMVQKLNKSEPNYLVLELDGDYKARIKIEADSVTNVVIRADKNDRHVVRLFKATEAETGGISFFGVKNTNLMILDPLPERKIEFIGNSITCAAASDPSDTPCGEGFYQDQHNAYLSYATRCAMALDAQFVLASVSGKGVYRNWNSLSPTIPELYENLYLNTDTNRKYDFSRYEPDLVSIALGTNDMSHGDGVKKRLPFDSAAFISEYVKFIGDLYNKYPSAQICLISSPMMQEPESTLLNNCLVTVQQRVNEKFIDIKPIAYKDLSIDKTPGGCSGHPDITDHSIIAEKLVPFYKELMGW